jgi:hypothetical protein
VKATRRAAVAASGVAALGLAGCTTGESGSPSTTTSASASSSTEPSATTDPDRAALDRAAEVTAGLLAQVQDAGPSLDPGRRLTNLHQAHLAALEEADGASASSAPVPPPPGRLARGQLRRHELAAQRELAMLAEAAQSGALARLLASMSAGIAAHLAVPEGGRP